MAPKKKKRGHPRVGAQIARFEHQRKMHVTHNLFGVVREVVRRAPWVWLAYCGYLSVEALAGKTTTFNTNLAAVVRLGANKYFLLMVMVLAGGSYYVKDRLKKRAIRGLQKHVKQLEEKVDPNRSSSRLTADGTPTPGDLDDA
jgi:hypothetical protein